MTKEYYTAETKKTKDVSKDLGEYHGVLSKFVDTDDGSIATKIERAQMVEIASTKIYTDWKSGVRELLTNEIKQCQIARNEHGANSSIYVEINPTERKLVIWGKDSMGMTGDKFGNVVAHLGRTHNNDRGSIGMFGMGIVSYNTMSSTMLIESHARETGDNFQNMAREGKDWKPIPDPRTGGDLQTDIPFGVRLTLTLNEDLGDEKFFKELYARIESVVSLHNIPTVINIIDEIDDDDDKWAIGEKEITLLDHTNYLKNLVKDANIKEHYGRDYTNWNTVYTIEKNFDDYDICVLYGLDNSSRPSDENWVFTTLIDVPIDNDMSGRRFIDKFNDRNDRIDGSLAGIPEFIGVLVNLKSESKFPPVASRDKLQEGWLHDDILENTYQMVDEWYNDHKVDSINDLFNMTSNEILAWQHFFSQVTDSHKGENDDREMLQKCFDLRFSIYDESKRKYDICTFYQMLTNTHKKLSSPVFFMNSFHKHWINAIDKQHDLNTPTYIRLAEKNKGSDKDKENAKLWKTYDYIIDKMSELPEDQRIITDSASWLKTHKVKAKRTTISRPKGSTVWHYNTFSNTHSNYSDEMYSHIYYTKERQDQLVRYHNNDWQKKRTKIQLSSKLWGKYKLGIDDISDILRAIPTDIAFCKADTQKVAIPVDKYIEGVMNRKVHTSDGNVVLKEWCESMKDNMSDKKEIRLIYYPYPEVVNEKCFSYDDNIVFVCGRDRDELIGLALALKTDRYLRGKDYPYISYNDKHLAEFDYYGSSSMENEKFAAVLPELVKNFVNTKELTSRWNRCEHRGCIMLGLVDLATSIPDEYFNDMAKSLTYCENYEQVKDNVVRIKELFNK